MKNLFEYGGVVSGNAFCNREKEATHLLQAIVREKVPGVISPPNLSARLRSHLCSCSGFVLVCKHESDLRLSSVEASTQGRGKVEAFLTRLERV